ncbi:MAG: recombinase family protein [Thermoleophilia bacterium]
MPTLALSPQRVTLTSTDPTCRPFPVNGLPVPFGALPGEAEVVDEIVELRRQKLSLGGIAASLDERGIPTRFGRRWSKPQVRRILRRVDPALAVPLDPYTPPDPEMAHLTYRERERVRLRRRRAHHHRTPARP